jgi:hypothetical protein
MLKIKNLRFTLRIPVSEVKELILITIMVAHANQLAYLLQ